MNIDENEFFRQATLRICGSLDIKKAMHLCLGYIETVMPVTWMSLYLYQQRQGMLTNLATVSHKGPIKPLGPLALPQKAVVQIEDEFSKWQEVKIVNSPEHDAVSRTVFQQTGKADISLLVMRLVIEETRLGALTIIAEDINCFNETHARLLGLLRRPFDVAVSNALRYMETVKLKDQLDAENKELSRELHHLSGDEIIGAESGLSGVMEMVGQVAPLDSPAMLLGETGVGKEVIANAIHYTSPRKNGPFIKVNCGAIPDTLFDSELFGHEKGAFTGATTRKRGFFERAHQGSIFLDEIGELPLQAQVRLLRVIQNKEINRVGGTYPIPVDVRIITATHRDLEKMIRTGEFREDLWFRLNIFPIMIPPLRQRKEDIPTLFHHFVRRKTRELKLQTPPPVSPAAIERLKTYTWPGNVRELQNLVERALIRSRGRDELPLDFPDDFSDTCEAPDIDEPARLFVSLDQMTIQHIKHALKKTGGRIYGEKGAAKLLDINPNTLRSRMRKLGIPFGAGLQ